MTVYFFKIRAFAGAILDSKSCFEEYIPSCIVNLGLNQGFLKGGNFKICGDERILEILELQMKSKIKRSQGAIALLNSLKGAIRKKEFE